MRTGTMRPASTAAPLLAVRQTSAARTWELTLDAELMPAAAALTPARARRVASLLAGLAGVRAVTVRPHCGGRFVLVTLTLEARDSADAIDRAAAYLRACAVDAGVGPLILVAARYASSG